MMSGGWRPCSKAALAPKVVSSLGLPGASPEELLQRSSEKAADLCLQGLQDQIEAEVAQLHHHEVKKAKYAGQYPDAVHLPTCHGFYALSSQLKSCLQTNICANALSASQHDDASI